MTILITGGLGVNGAWITRKLLERGLPVIVVDRHSDLTLLGDAGAGVELVQADIMDADAMRVLMASRKVSCVIHTAALISGLQQNPLEGFRVNALGTVQMLDASLKAGVKRFVYTSSRAAYGNFEGEHSYPVYKPVAEDYRLGGVNVYDVTKLSSELMGRNFAALGLEFIALRFATIFGPGKLVRHGPMGIYSRFIENAMAGVPLRIEKGGDERDDVIYVDDIAEACVIAATHPNPKFDAYNISRCIATTLGEFADAVRTVLPRADIEIGPGLDPLGLGVKYFGRLDNRRAREDLGFAPKFDFETGIADYVAKMKEFGLPPTIT
ncbi:NAD(P)-dependent oxidoreductase [Aquibium sp. LZ166]|uniref:NAD(P)-dependent oxidoreductase n=1 Tax=Aquibium pacificus TaxID=3153579 RepID=A0ABV3SH96_9HYPH